MLATKDKIKPLYHLIQILLKWFQINHDVPFTMMKKATDVDLTKQLFKTLYIKI